MDAILGYHMNPLTCGVAKFNLALARRLGVAVRSVLDADALEYRRPLVSIKLSEFTTTDAKALAEQWERLRRCAVVLFLHDFSGTDLERRMIKDAALVYCGNAELTTAVTRIGGTAVEVWCPETLVDTQRFGGAELSVFSFGMAHKVQVQHYRRLHALLEATGRSYCLYLSTALHDDTTFDQSFTQAFEELKTIFGGTVYFLGYLSDTAVFNYLSDTTFFAAFFDHGVRANNTSVHAAMHCGSIVVTNLDTHSPRSFVHLETVVDILRCDALPLDTSAMTRIRTGARRTAQAFGWDALLAAMTRHEDVVPSRRLGPSEGPR